MSLDEVIFQVKEENEVIEEATLLEKIGQLLPKQKAAVIQCFEAATRKSPKGMRHNPEWLLECIIMRIKSPRLYEHIQREKNLSSTKLLLPQEVSKAVREYVWF